MSLHHALRGCPPSVRGALAALGALTLAGCATASPALESPSLSARWPALKTLGIVAPAVVVPDAGDDPRREDWAREGEGVVVAALASELQARHIGTVLVEPIPARKARLVELARLFEDVSDDALHAAEHGRSVASPRSFGDLSAMARSCGVDGFVLASALATPPRRPPGPAEVGKTADTSLKSVTAPGGTGDLFEEPQVGLEWLAVGIVDASGELLWLGTGGSPGDPDPDKAAEVAEKVASDLPGRVR